MTTPKYKPRYKASREELETWYAQAVRERGAAHEWFSLTHGTGAAKWGREHVFEVDIPVVAGFGFAAHS